MRKLRMLYFSVLCILMSAVTTFAQDAADNEASVNKYKAIAAGFGFGIAASAVEGAARNPGAAGRIQIMMIIGLALIESLVLFALVIVFAKV